MENHLNQEDFLNDAQLNRLIQLYLSCNEEQRTALVEIVNLTTQIIKGEN